MSDQGLVQTGLLWRSEMSQGKMDRPKINCTLQAAVLTVVRIMIVILGMQAVLNGSILYAEDIIESTVEAGETELDVSGKVYSFGDKAYYEMEDVESETEAVINDNVYGRFFLSGDLELAGSDGEIDYYAVNQEQVGFVYEYPETYISGLDNEWHFINDNAKSILNAKIKSGVGKGALILQTSKDGEHWINEIEIPNYFSSVQEEIAPFYKTKNVQLKNGCYYRLLVGYRIQRKVGQSQILFVKNDVKETERIAEVYEFYLVSGDHENKNLNLKSKALGTLTKTDYNKGFSGSKEIGIDDAHYGWEIGKFYVSGYTRETKDDDKNPVFLKNVGDQITLWFKLEQDINQLNGDEELIISNDGDGYDQYFQTPKTNLGRGALIIRYTNENGEKQKPEIYTNYLEANARVSADTVVQVFEEGDYEVALDYELKKTPRKIGALEIIPEYSNYRLAFKFSVRNGNCMVYPFDSVTGRELADKDITENGFKLDMARSRYLTIDVTRSVLVENENGLSEDVRFNRPAKDGDEYTDEGIYTFNVKNLYTGENTKKTIYVGTDKYLKYLSGSKKTVAELNEVIGNGSRINEDGNLDNADD